MPVRVAPTVARLEPGLLLELPYNAAWDINRTIPDVVEIGRARRKINAPGIGGVRAHFAHHERTIGTAQRAHPGTVEDILVGEAPVAPRQEACEIGLEVTGAETLAGEDRLAPEQHAAVPQFRPLALLQREMRGDVRAPFLRERPRPWLHGQVKRRDAMNDRGSHQRDLLRNRHLAFIPVVFLT